MARNGQVIGTSSIEHYRRTLINTSLQKDEATSILDKIDSLEDIIEDVSGQFMHAEGTGCYAMHSKLNHSYEANAEIRIPFNNNTLQVVAVRHIKAGEEVTINYGGGSIDDHDCCSRDSDDGDMEEDIEEGGQERRELLREFYMFDCKCRKCLAELNASL